LNSTFFELNHRKEENMKSRRKIIKSFVFVGLVFVFAFSLVSQLEAQHKRLRGEYAVVGEATCRTHWLVNPHGGTTSTYYIHTHSVQGTVTFNGDGTGSGQVSTVDVTHPIYTPIPMASYWGDPDTDGILGQTSSSNVVFEFTYTVAPDGAISRTITNLEGIFTWGPNLGKTFTQTGFTLTGFVSKDKGTIFLSSVPGQAESLTTEIFKADGTPYGTQEQECHRSRVLTLISK
jgi:hypothetical protein